MSEDAFAAEAVGSSGFLLRTVTFIGWPPAWSEARSRGLAGLLLGLFLVSGAFGVALGVFRGWQFGGALEDAATSFDASYDPIVVEAGLVRVDGPRIVHTVDPGGRNTILVDPAETVPDAAVTTPEWVIVRRDMITRRRAFGQVETWPVNDVQKVLGIDPLVLDGAHLRGFNATWGRVFQLGTAAMVLAFSLVRDFFGSVLYAAIAATALGLLPAAAGWTFAERLRVAIAASMALLIPGWILLLVGFGAPCCSNLIVWPGLLTALTGVGIGLSAPKAPSPSL